MSQTVATLAVAALLLTTTLTAGCIAGSDPPLPNAQTQIPQQPQPIERVPVMWEGEIHAQACHQGDVDTCNRVFLKSEDHVRWFEVELPSMPVAGELSVEWEAQESPDTGLYLRLVCWDRAVRRCAGEAPDLARDEGTQGPLEVAVHNLDFLRPSTTLYVAFGVPARDTQAGDYHPAADLEFTINGVFLVPSGAS